MHQSIVNGEYAGKALVLKIWPESKKAKMILSTDLNAKLDVLMQRHCQK